MKKNVSRLDRLPIGTRIVTIFCLAWAAFVALLPLVWLLISSFKEDPLARPGFQLPESMYFQGYISTFRDLDVMKYRRTEQRHITRRRVMIALIQAGRCHKHRVYHPQLPGLTIHQHGKRFKRTANKQCQRIRRIVPRGKQ